MMMEKKKEECAPETTLEEKEETSDPVKTEFELIMNVQYWKK